MAQSFQSGVTYAAIVIFIIFMALVAMMMMRAKADQVFPSNVPPCPDYFEILDDGACKNVKGLGTGVCTDPANFSAKKYQGIDGRKEKCKWAKGCGVEWDGITNVQGLC